MKRSCMPVDKDGASSAACMPDSAGRALRPGGSWCREPAGFLKRKGQSPSPPVRAFTNFALQTGVFLLAAACLLGRADAGDNNLACTSDQGLHYVTGSQPDDVRMHASIASLAACLPRFHTCCATFLFFFSFPFVFFARFFLKSFLLCILFSFQSSRTFRYISLRALLAHH